MLNNFIWKHVSMSVYKTLNRKNSLNRMFSYNSIRPPTRNNYKAAMSERDLRYLSAELLHGTGVNSLWSLGAPKLSRRGFK